MRATSTINLAQFANCGYASTSWHGGVNMPAIVILLILIVFLLGGGPILAALGMVIFASWLIYAVLIVVVVVISIIAFAVYTAAGDPTEQQQSRRNTSEEQLLSGTYIVCQKCRKRAKYRDWCSHCNHHNSLTWSRTHPWPNRDRLDESNDRSLGA